MTTATTWLPDEAPGADSLDRLLDLRPDLAVPYRELVGALWGALDPVLVDLCRLRVAQLLGCETELRLRTAPAVAAGLTEEQVAHLGSWPTASCFDESQRAALAVADRFVLDVHGVDDEARHRLGEHLALPERVALAEALAIFDGFHRVRIVLGAGPDHDDIRVVAAPPPPGLAGTASLPADDPIGASVLAEQPRALLAFLRLYGTLWSRGRLDHPTKEIARLRNARITDCGY